MIVPICTAVMREVFSQAPPGEKEGALALGGTRWGVIKSVVLPFGRGGIIGGSMLGLGRALGETIAVTLIISPLFNPHSAHARAPDRRQLDRVAHRAPVLGSRTRSVSARSMAAGLTLFVITLVVNAIASIIVARSRSGASTEI